MTRELKHFENDRYEILECRKESPLGSTYYTFLVYSKGTEKHPERSGEWIAEFAEFATAVNCINFLARTDEKFEKGIEYALEKYGEALRKTR